MNRFAGQLRTLAENCALLGRAAASSLGSHWALGLFSLVAAFGVWIAIQDVDNPRVEGEAPAPGTGGIQVVAINVPEGYIVANDLDTVRVRVNAREGDLEELQPGAFEATVDVSTVPLDGSSVPRRVRVEANKRGVDVLAVIGAGSSGQTDAINVALVRAETKDVPVTARILTPPPPGFASNSSPTFDPAIVRISGKPAAVASVASVDLDVNLGNARDDQVTIPGTFVARTASGNAVDVRITPATGEATFVIEEVFAQRTMQLNANITGSPAPGYRISNISVDPTFVQVTGPKAIVDNLSGPLSLEAIDITGARQRQTATRTVERPPNVSTDRQSAVVVVEIVAIDCSDAAGSTCGALTLFLAPRIEEIPSGLLVEPLTATVQVRISGPLAQMSTVKLEDFQAVISLAGAPAGTAPHTARVTAPAGIRVDSVQPISITLRTATSP